LKNANKLGHPGSSDRVIGAILRCLRVKVRNTMLQLELGVADANDQRSFSSYEATFNAWTDANARAFEYRLAALDGEQQKPGEAA
jgi:hypothetical protein